MLLVQDQYVQDSRKNFDSEFQLKQNTSKQVFSDPKEIWEIESGCEEEAITSENDSEGEDNILYADPSDIPEEILETRGQNNSRKKNVRFGDHFNYVLDTSETSSLDNEYFGIDCGYLEAGRRRSLSQDPEMSNYKPKDYFRVPQKSKWRIDCGYGKVRPKSSPEKSVGYLDGLEKRQINLGDFDRMRRKEHRCGRYHFGDFDDVTYRRSTDRYKFDCGDVVIPRCCEHCFEKKSYGKIKPVASSSHKHICQMNKDTESEVKNHRKLRVDNHHDPQTMYHGDRHFPEEYYDHGYLSKTKKKTLEAVQEQQEQFSDSTYKIPCTKFSSQTIPGELTGFTEKLNIPTVSDWLYYGGRGNGGSAGAPRIHKMRSRRTRMNKIKNGWKKALVQTVRDGSRNERVGVIVMGSKGPEFYAKNSKPTGFVPFRKSKSFLDGAAKSFEVMTVDCKNVFLSSSEPGPRTNHAFNDLVCPEDDDKVEEKIARFSKNVNDIVKNSEEKFYKALSSSEYPGKKNPMEGVFKGAGEGAEEEVKKETEKKEDMHKTKFPFHFPTFDTISPRVPKSLRKPEKKISVDSKAMADALNEQAKQYIENQSSLKDKEESFLEGLKELQEKFPPREMNQEAVEANLSLWGMKLDQLAEKTDVKEAEENSNKDDNEKSEEKEKSEKDERSQIGSVRSLDRNNVSKQMRKKHYEQTNEKLDQEGDAVSSKPHSVIASPKKLRRVKKLECPNELADRQKDSEDVNSSLISAVFRDLVENGCAISQEESENLQSVFNQVSFNQEVASNDMSSSSSEVINTIRESKINVSPRSPKTPTSLEEKIYKEIEKEEKAKTKGNYKKEKGNDEERKSRNQDLEGLLEEVTKRKVLEMRNIKDEKTFDEKLLDLKICKKIHGKQKEGKSKKKNVLEDKMRLLRQALPSIAAENEAAHLKQLKKYIDRFIDRVEASTNSEYSKRKEIRHKSKGTPSTDSSEVRVDACKILDIVSNPFKKISSEVTINIAKKLTDTLVQDKSMRGPKMLSNLTKPRKQSENETDDEGFVACNASSGSERCEEHEPTYLKQLKKMRNEHLNNILLEVKRLSELLRFLDRCNRLHF